MADSVSFESRDRGKAAIEREVRASRRLVALVGIPGNAQPPSSASKGSSINMASLAFILEKGSPVNRLPPRPFMLQTRQRASTGKFPALMARLYRGVVTGRMKAAKAIKRLGAAYEDEMKAIFTRGVFVPNSAITIDGGWMRNRVSGKPFKVKGKKSSRPLIDTSRLRQSIVHKVVKV